VRAGRGRGVVNNKEVGPESELDVEITEAFLLRADRVADKVESGDREMAAVETTGVNAAPFDVDGVLDAGILAVA